MSFIPRDKLRKAVVEPEEAASVPAADGIPGGFLLLEHARVYVNPTTGRVVVTGLPDEERDPTGEMHNCDEWGCNWEHVFGRFQMGERERAHFTAFYGGTSIPTSRPEGSEEDER